ncbi:MAG: T9SS type A sorting domain-containing protein [bacterium]
MCIYTGSATGKNNIIYDNHAANYPDLYGSPSFTYSCIGGGLPGTGNINANPLLINAPPAGFCFLSQIAAGQGSDSPCVNTGDPTYPMITGSTRSDLVQDAGIIDMGYHWQFALDLSGHTDLWEEFSVTTPTIPEAVPESMELKVDNFPNPFNPSTTIALTLNQSTPVELTVTDVSGRVIANLFEGTLEAGMHDFLFEGATLPTGMYFYRAQAAGRTVTGKALLIK